MSNEQGGPPRGAPPPAGAYGPGQTVLGGAGYGDDAIPPQASARANAGAPIPPTTVRDAHTDFGGARPSPYDGPAPYEVPPPYGTPGSPYGGGGGASETQVDPVPPLVAPIGVPPPPPGRGRGKAGPSLAVIGLVSFVGIGSVVTAVVLVRRPSSGDDKPVPTVEIPAPPSPPADAGGPAAPTEQPSAAPAPTPVQRTPPQRPSQMLHPGNRPGRPGNLPGNLPGNNGPNGPFNPRLPRRPR